METKMIFTDTHSHIYDRAFDADREAVIERAFAAGVERVFLPAVDENSNEALFEVAKRYPDNCFAMVGLHPTSVNDNPDYRRELERVEYYLKNPPVERIYAIGEVGMDLYWSTEWEVEQKEVFARQIVLASEYALPLVIHTRNAWAEMIDILEAHKNYGLRGVMHSFAGSGADYRRIKSLGDFVFGIGGVVTYKNSDIARLVPLMELEDIVLETDSPYLTPVPYRGKRNESCYIPIIAERVAELKSVSLEHLARQTTENSRRIFDV